MARRGQNSEHQGISSQDVPSKRVKQGLRPVSPPFQTTRLSRLIYALIFLTVFLGAYYSYRLVQYKRHVGGWWDVALCHNAQPNQIPVEHPQHHPGSVEDKINDLAKALGMPSKDLASAIAMAVHKYVPPASLSSVAAKETGPAVQALLKEPHSERPSEASTTGVADVVSGVVEGVGNLVGMDEP